MRPHTGSIFRRTLTGKFIRLRDYSWPLITSVIVVGLVDRAPSIVDAHDNAFPTGVHLQLPAGYVAMSPVSRTLDALSLLSVPQTIWLFVGFALVVATSILRGGYAGRRPLLLSLGMLIAGLLASVASIEAAVILLPRPMASLSVADPEILRIDFHSHTNASRDANQRFTAADNREWHRAGGFDVAYISDHVRFGGAADAMRANPQRAGDGLTILSAVEGRYHKIISTVMLGLVAADTAVLDGKGHLLPGTTSMGKGPVTIVAIPNPHIDSVTPASLDSLPHFAAIELVDAAPRGLGQLDSDEPRIRRIAAAQHLILVSSSNNHGWGRTVAAWNLMRIPGWKDLRADSLSTLIEEPFRDRRLDAVTIVKRLRPRTHGLTLPLTLPVAAYQVLAELSLGERGVWLVWIWALFLIASPFRRNRITSYRSA